MTPLNTYDYEPEPLLQLELEIARRADELSLVRGPRRDLECWLEAEQEVLGREESWSA